MINYVFFHMLNRVFNHVINRVNIFSRALLSILLPPVSFVLILRASEFGFLHVSWQLGTFPPHQSRYDASISDAPRLDALSNYFASIIDVLSAILDFYHLHGYIESFWLNHRQKVLLTLTWKASTIVEVLWFKGYRSNFLQIFSPCTEYARAPEVLSVQ